MVPSIFEERQKRSFTVVEYIFFAQMKVSNAEQEGVQGIELTFWSCSLLFLYYLVIYSVSGTTLQ